ncbi:MAG: DsbE family thiol:disulfide interchange protein [Nitrospira sp.]|nr:DsbE family thiol:disulfide interchange protein [Nitrospira sp.]
MSRFFLPLAIFGIMVGFLAVGLTLNPREIPSPLVGKEAPAFSRQQLHEQDKVFARTDLAGQVWLLNFWASWCSGCKTEHPVLMELAKSGAVPIYGMDYKDQRDEALAWLNRWGNPYQIVGVDLEGRVGIDYGVYGVPETYVIDKQGVIRYKQIGPVNDEVLAKTILPLVKELQAK